MTVIEEEQNKQPFDPSKTDVLGYNQWGFIPEGFTPELYISIPSAILMGILPRWMATLANRLNPTTPPPADPFHPIKHTGNPNDKIEVDILDARKKATGTFAERGFTLVDVGGDTPSGDQNWNSPPALNALHEKLEQQLREFYPNAFQKESEALVLTYYSRGKHFANPKGYFRNPNWETRRIPTRTSTWR